MRPIATFGDYHVRPSATGVGFHINAHHQPGFYCWMRRRDEVLRWAERLAQIDAEQAARNHANCAPHKSKLSPNSEGDA